MWNLLLVLACVGLTVACAPKPDEARGARHLILVTVDTLRVDRLGVYGHGSVSAPTIDSLAAESIVFEHAYAHSSMTLPSVASLLTGLLPSQHGLVGNRGHLAPGVVTLAELARERGFRTAAFVGNFALRSSRGLDRGFDRYTEEFSQKEAVRGHRENLAAPLTDRALEWLDAQPPGEPLFLWVHYQDPHGPYTPPRFEPPVRRADEVELPRSATNSGRAAIPSYQWLGTGRLSEYEARYNGEIEEVDRQLARLVDGLRSKEILDDSVFVFSADHGEAFGEEGLYCAHGEGLGAVLLRVPLFVRLPGLPPARRADRVRLVDVLPTLATLIDFDPLDAWAGSTLLEDLGDRTLVSQLSRGSGESWRTVWEGPWALTEERGGEATLMPWKPSAGPGSADLRATQKHLASTLEEHAPWPTDSPVADETPEEREALRALGYVD